jgi:hypothetical protein
MQYFDIINVFLENHRRLQGERGKKKNEKRVNKSDLTVKISKLGLICLLKLEQVFIVLKPVSRKDSGYASVRL